MKKHFLLIFLSLGAFAQNFPVSSIPDSLKINAHAVVREYKTKFEVINAGEAITQIEGAITILDESGDHHADFWVPFNKFTKIDNMEAQLLDAHGNQIKRLKKADIESYGGWGAATDISDSKIKHFKLNHLVYPYTFVFKVVYKGTNMMFYPSWEAYPNNVQETAVQYSSFDVSMPNSLKLRYKEQNLTSGVVISGGEERTHYHWEAKNLVAFEQESYSPALSETMPMVYTAPSQFKVEEYNGNLRSWADLGKFYTDLSKGRQELSPELISKLNELVKTEKTNVDKIQKIYQHLQQTTRYVSIQLGIGGWQTTKASEVAQKGYGDCKALTTYTQGMLQAIGIPSFPVLVRAGANEGDILTDFPSFQFNHVFLCVPQEKDSLWLECTSQHNPFGYLSDFTSNRHGLLVQNDSGKLIKIPSYQIEDNRLNRKANIFLNENGEAVAETQTTFSGLQQDTYADVLDYMSKDEQKKWLLKHLSLPSVEINNFTLEKKMERLPSVSEKLSLHLRNVASKSGTRMFLGLNLFNANKTIPLLKPNRKAPVELHMNYSDSDSLSFQIPAGFIVEFLPEKMNITSKFGTYSASVQMQGDKVLYIRRMTMKQGKYPAQTFTELVDFKKKVVKYDRIQLVFIKK